MGRPIEVTDDEVIKAGQKISANGARVSGTRLWRELSKRGRPERLAAVWTDHIAATTPNQDRADTRPLLPEAAARLSTNLKVEFAAGVDRVAAAIYDEVHATVTGRFQGELAAMTASRDAYTREVAEALEAVGESADDQSKQQERIEQLEQELWAVKSERDVEHGLRAQTIEENQGLLARVETLEVDVRAERSAASLAVSALAGAEVKAEMLRAELQETTLALASARVAASDLERQLGALQRGAQVHEQELSRHAAELVELRLELKEMGAKHQEQVTRAVSAEIALQATERAMAVAARAHSRALSRQPARRALPLHAAASAELTGGIRLVLPNHSLISGEAQTDVRPQGPAS